MLWSVALLPDPLQLIAKEEEGVKRTVLIHGSCSLSEWTPQWPTIRSGGRVARVALADYIARHRLASCEKSFDQQSIRWESLPETHAHSHKQRFGEPTNHHATPFVLERSDVVATLPDELLHVYLRLFLYTDSCDDEHVKVWTSELLLRLLTFSEPDEKACLTHIAVAVFQDRLRVQLRGKAVGFIADGSILPRASGASTDPMKSPPAVPFLAPPNSSLGQTVSVEMNEFAAYLQPVLPQQQTDPTSSSSTTITLTGMVIPLGVSLIVGGGYHGKSTLLRCIAAGVYNKVPGDGREFCVTLAEALTVRAEDGRYVSHCNVSAFLSNLPIANATTTQFSTLEASGSTSQAANVMDAIEMGAQVLLVDEDVSAANFMARDGRMRALVMDESITPLLYRVNGLHDTLRISTVVVVGGVGDWLDVPDAVMLLDKYVCYDATAKARSISKQFSHGHVQYAGRGVVHRLPWDKKTTPHPRRPLVGEEEQYTLVSLMNGRNGIVLHGIETTTSTPSMIDMSRIEQLLGGKSQLLGCGLGVLWVLAQAAKNNTEKSLWELLQDLDKKIDQDGMVGLLIDTPSWSALVESQGFVYRPRLFEVGQAILRLRTVTMQEIPVEDDGVEAAKEAEAERRKQELLEIWNNRRNKSN